MKTSLYSLAQNPFRAAHNLLRRWLGRGTARKRVLHDSGSYVGLFQGVIETDAPVRRPQTPPSGRAAGFLRLEVSRQKKSDRLLPVFRRWRGSQWGHRRRLGEDGFCRSQFPIGLPTRPRSGENFPPSRRGGGQAAFGEPTCAAPSRSGRRPDDPLRLKLAAGREVRGTAVRTCSSGEVA